MSNERYRFHLKKAHSDENDAISYYDKQYTRHYFDKHCGYAGNCNILHHYCTEFELYIKKSVSHSKTFMCIVTALFNAFFKLIRRVDDCMSVVVIMSSHFCIIDIISSSNADTYRAVAM